LNLACGQLAEMQEQKNNIVFPEAQSSKCSRWIQSVVGNQNNRFTPRQFPVAEKGAPDDGKYDNYNRAARSN